MKNEDELASCESHGDDYTIKVYRKRNGRFYSVAVHETDVASEVTFVSETQQDAVTARKLALDSVGKPRTRRS